MLGKRHDSWGNRMMGEAVQRAAAQLQNMQQNDSLCLA